MCDTMVHFDQHAMMCAKNSDRDPKELQVIHYCEGDEGIPSPTHPEQKHTYNSTNYQTLIKASQRMNNSIRALISRPCWMWGAEMGVNERRVFIGNEAVFSWKKTKPHGLLGMDLLRLALHNAQNAEEALDIIIELLAMYGQGGNASYNGNLSYHNSFLIADPSHAYILETAQSRYAIQPIDSYASISNTYTIGTNYERSDDTTAKKHPHFSRYYGMPLSNLVTKGNIRQQHTEQMMSTTSNQWTSMRDILISSYRGKRDDHSMASVCMDANRFFLSRTTASMIAQLDTPLFPHVYMTGAPLPNLNPFLPFAIDETSFTSNPFCDINFSYRYAQARSALTERMLKAPDFLQKSVSELARSIENTVHISDMHTTSAEVFQLWYTHEHQFVQKVTELLDDARIPKGEAYPKPDCYWHCG